MVWIMMIHEEISFSRKSCEEGFGFICMKAAYLYGVTGRMDYSPGTEVRILAEGEQSRMSEFIEWIGINLADPKTMLTHNTLNYSGKFKEFDIYLHSIQHII